MPIASTTYYECHCSGCGTVTTADLLAFDFGPLISAAVNITAQRAFGKSEKWLPLEALDMGFYFTWRKLQQQFHLIQGKEIPFVFTVRDLKEHLRECAQVTSFDELLAIQDPRDSRIYGIMTGRILPPREAGKKVTRESVDYDDLAAKIKQVVFLCSKRLTPDENEVIAQFNVRVNIVLDDRGHPFPKSLDVQYEDGTWEAVVNNVCPRCGKSFYEAVGLHQEIIIGMAGSARVGKTAYLAALYNQINQYPGGLMTVMPSNDPDWRYFEERIINKYRNVEKIDKTHLEGDAETIPLFSLEIKILGRSYIFTFIDMPGEAYSEPEEQDAEQGRGYRRSGGMDKGRRLILNDRRIIQYASMIWCCIDPQQIDAEVKRIQVAMSNEANALDMVDTDLMRVLANVRKTMAAVCSQGKKNAAVLITKADTILNQDRQMLFRPNERVMERYITPSGCLNFQAAKEFTGRSYAYLKRQGKIAETMKEMFARFTAFAVAAYGSPVPSEEAMGWYGALKGDGFDDDDYRPRELMPSMIELPFLWTLATLGIIGAEKTVPEYRQVKKGSVFRRQYETVIAGYHQEQVPWAELYDEPPYIPPT